MDARLREIEERLELIVDAETFDDYHDFVDTLVDSDVPYLLNALQHMSDEYAGAESARQELEYALRMATVRNERLRGKLHATDGENERLKKTLKTIAEAIHSVYPAVAGRVIALARAQEMVAHEHWANVAKRLYDAETAARGAEREGGGSSNA